jgi:CBS domain-containing protein
MLTSFDYNKDMGKVRNILQCKGSVVFSVAPTVTVYQAIELMSIKDIGGLLITDQRGKLLGIFTERDYARKLILKGKSSKDTLIGELMTEDPSTVTPDTSIEDCMKTISNRFIRHLPVVDNGELVGLISIGDIVRYIMDEQLAIIEELEIYITGHHQ